MPASTHTSDLSQAPLDADDSTSGPIQPGSGAGRRGRGRPRRPIRWLLAIVAVLIVVVAGSVALRKGSSDSWTTVWADNFSGANGSAPSSANWRTSTGTSYPGGAAQWGTGEIETYTDSRSNLALDGRGDLKITATRSTAGVWSSGRVETQQTGFQPAAGHVLKVEARIQTPDGGAGYWPAFWMLGAPFRGVYTNWPGIGEIDIMENSGGDPATVHGTFHCGVDPGGPCDETNGLSGKHTGQSALSAGFHTYSVEWDRTNPVAEIRWYVDGHEYYSVKSTQVDPTTWANATNHGFFILLNLAIGGSFPGPTAADTRATGSMLVDYVKVSQH
jgi:beta-glucanase (GH16 family)